MGDMSEYYLNGYDIEDEFNDPDYQYTPSPKRCRYCGQEGLFWKNINGLWRLVDVKDVQHRCMDKTEKRMADRANKL